MDLAMEEGNGTIANVNPTFVVSDVQFAEDLSNQSSA